MCRQAAHRTYTDTQLSKGSLICELYPLIPHALLVQFVGAQFQVTRQMRASSGATHCYA
jgi:hypothetical protein